MVNDFIHSGLEALDGLEVALAVGVLKEAVVLLIHGQLEWVLVVSEQSVMAIGQVCQGSSLYKL